MGLFMGLSLNVCLLPFLSAAGLTLVVVRRQKR
jgi:hypothetical protein